WDEFRFLPWQRCPRLHARGVSSSDTSWSVLGREPESPRPSISAPSHRSRNSPRTLCCSETLPNSQPDKRISTELRSLRKSLFSGAASWWLVKVAEHLVSGSRPRPVKQGYIPVTLPSYL